MQSKTSRFLDVSPPAAPPAWCWPPGRHQAVTPAAVHGRSPSIPSASPKPVPCWLSQMPLRQSARQPDHRRGIDLRREAGLLDACGNASSMALPNSRTCIGSRRSPVDEDRRGLLRRPAAVGPPGRLRPPRLHRFGIRPPSRHGQGRVRAPPPGLGASEELTGAPHRSPDARTANAPPPRVCERVGVTASIPPSTWKITERSVEVAQSRAFFWLLFADRALERTRSSGPVVGGLVTESWSCVLALSPDPPSDLR